MPTALATRPAGDCPVERAIAQLADKWKLQILLVLADQEVVRFRELQRQVHGVSQKVLTKALRELEADGLVERTVYAEVPPRVEYRPSPRCAQLLPILAQLQDWAVSTSAAGA
ncbi:MAG TPA: helix-turn-helix domain-containing protein [Candidatus Sulfotelmatobacter sp.]|nr:helix-turn-helix domain-containing protein [Candidatus Sulfotelmatobacter sp.]